MAKKFLEDMKNVPSFSALVSVFVWGLGNWVTAFWNGLEITSSRIVELLPAGTKDGRASWSTNRGTHK